MQKKAIFFDVDGTLYAHRNHDIPQSAKDALCALKEAGHFIGFATSRCRCECENLPKFFREFPFDAKIYDGGALILYQDAVYQKIPVDPRDLEYLNTFSANHGLGFRYSTFDGDYIAHNGFDWMLEEFFRLYLNFPVIKPYEQEDVYNVLMYLEDPALMQPLIEGLRYSHHVILTDQILEVTNGAINKAEGVKGLCTHCGFDIADIICFGDGENDVSMLKMAGIGVAMGNASDAVKNAADLVTTDIDANGIANALKKLNLIKE